MQINRFIRNSVLLFIGMAVFGGSVQIVDAAEPIPVGVLHSTKYPYATMMKNSFEMALAEVNRSGIKGRPLKLIYADDQGERKAGEQAVRRLVTQKGVRVLVGAYQSSNTVYMARIAEKLGVPLLVCTAADDRVTQRKWPYVFRLNPPAGDYAKGLEDLFKARIKPRSMAIVYENSPFGTGGALRMMWFCRENDIETKAIIPYHKERARNPASGSAYFKRLLNPLATDSPDVIYMVSYLDDAVLLVKNINALKINALLCGGAGGFTHQKFLDKAGREADYLLTATLWSPQSRRPGARAFYDAYIQKHTVPPDYHGAEAYSALFVIADALRRADTLEPAAVRKALAATDMQTPFGSVKFVTYNQYAQQNKLSTLVLQVIDGQYHSIWPESIANQELIPRPGWRQ